ncbi:3-keto-5-aminohexanoate cleavage protein, partial [Phaeobacter sp. HF9A]|nr:3-keto-5-aminohexanoate cleavage protein [Phaeobacter sp. HF9A]
MPLLMNREVFITCAVTGSGGTQDRSPHVPRSPREIAESAIAAAKAGAAVVHCHVRDPDTGAPSRDLALYREVTDRIRDSDTDVVLNLTAGMGGDIIFGGVEAPLPVKEVGTDMIGAEARVAHVAECLPEICTLDCGTMNFAEADYVMTNTPGMLQAMGRRMTELGVKPEIEAFDTGHLWYAKQLVEDGILEPDALVQLCMGVPWGAPDDLNTFMAMVNNVPAFFPFSAFALGRHQMPYVAASVLAGGNVRVGLEDNLYLDKGVLAQNWQLVERAAGIVSNLGARVITPAEVREKLGLVKRAPVAGVKRGGGRGGGGPPPRGGGGGGGLGAPPGGPRGVPSAG